MARALQLRGEGHHDVRPGEGTPVFLFGESCERLHASHVGGFSPRGEGYNPTLREDRLMLTLYWAHLVIGDLSKRDEVALRWFRVGRSQSVRRYEELID